MIALRNTVRDIGVEALVAWAFGTERASLEGKGRQIEIPYHLGYGSLQNAILQMAALGVRVDTSQSGATFLAAGQVHWDAEAVAGILAGMIETREVPTAAALAVVEHASAGTRPTWLRGAVTRVIPKPLPYQGPESGWITNRHGRRARTEIVRTYTVQDHRGRVSRVEEAFCPVAYDPPQQRIDAARKAYLAWWGALHDLRERLLAAPVLQAHKLTKAMPPVTPWIEAPGRAEACTA